MNHLPIVRGAFLDELEKIAIAMGRLRMPKSRKGRRSMRVDTFLRKEKEGTLYKQAGLLEDAAARAFDRYRHGSSSARVSELPKAKCPPAGRGRTPCGEVPTRDDDGLPLRDETSAAVPRILGPGALQNPEGVL